MINREAVRAGSRVGTGARSGVRGSMINLDDEFRSAVADLLKLPELALSRDRTHHFHLSEFDHLLRVARRAHRFSQFVKADARVCARAGLLHDLGAHWFDTVAPYELAGRLEEPASVRHAIRAHTLLPVVPRTREAWVVVAADFVTSAQECRFALRHVRDQAGQRLHILRLRVSRRHPLPRRRPTSPA